MAVIANLVAKFSADTKSFDKGTSKMRKGLGAFRAGIIGAIGVGGLGALVKGSIDAADNIQKLSIRLGASTEALSEMRHVATLSGVDFKTLTTGMQRMTRRLAEVAQFGKGPAKEALETLGLSAAELAKMKPEEQYERIAEALNGVEDQSLKVALAMKIFDTEGVSLLQTMTGGAAGIREMREEAKRLGLSMSREMADGAADANDAVARLTASFAGMIQKVTLANTGVLTDLANFFTDILPGAINGLVTLFNGLGKSIGASAAVMAAFLTGDFAGVASIGREVLSDIRSGSFTNGATANARNEPTKEEKELVAQGATQNQFLGEMVGILRTQNRSVDLNAFGGNL